MHVLGEVETVVMIRDNKLSVSRYGDGEFKLAVGGHAKSQKAEPMIAKMLRNILRSNIEDHMVAIPRIYEPRTDWPTEKKSEFWKPFATDKTYLRLLDKKKVYGSSFITRPDSSGLNDTSYYELIKSLWKDRSVLLIKGSSAGFDKDPSIFNTAWRYRVIDAPDQDAFSEHYKLLEYVQAIRYNFNKVIVVLSLGPAATVLAYEFAVVGIQALDLGHLGMFYAKIHPRQLNGEVV